MVAFTICRIAVLRRKSGLCLASLRPEREGIRPDTAFERRPACRQGDWKTCSRAWRVAADSAGATPVTEIIDEQLANALLCARDCCVLAWLRAGEPLGQALRVGVQLLVRERWLDFGYEMDAAAAREL